MEENKMDIKAGGARRRLFGSNRAAGVFAVAAALAAAGMAVLTPFLAEERECCESAAFEGIPAEQAGIARAKYCRDSVYSDLCALGSVYLSNCTDGVYGGSRELYEELYSKLSEFDPNYAAQAEELFGIKNAGTRALKIEQTKFTITNIDSDYYYFYVAYGDEHLTNIPDLPDKAAPMDIAGALADEHPDWYYLRRGMTIDTKTRYDESGLAKTEVYYTAAGTDEKPSITSEYIDSDKLIYGACSRDSYGRYICCFDGTGDNILFEEQPPDAEDLGSCYYQLDSEGDLHVTEYQGEGMVEYVVKKDQPYYKSLIAVNGGITNASGYWTALEDMPDYTITPVNLSGLTVFMTPKTDIVAAFDSFVSRHRSVYETLGILRLILIGVFGVSAAAAMTAMLVRRRIKLEADGRPYVYSLFKTDVSLAAVLLSAWLFLILFRIIAGGGADTSDILRLTAHGCAAAGAVTAFMLGASGLIRQLKLGAGGKREYLAADIWRCTAGGRRRFKERFYGSALMQSLGRLGILTRHRLRFWTALISGAIFLLILMTTGYSGGILAALPFGLISAAAGLAYIIGADRTAKDIGRLAQQAESMTGADGTDMKRSENPLDISSPIYSLGQKLESVSDAAEKAVEERVKSEKLKVELVTNVSHDLKTPLTSIISYIDLLEKSELSDEAHDYVSILSRKADKLREIVADVFTLAKAVSGAEVDMAELDFAVMARQVTADNEDKAERSGRELRLDIRPGRAPIMADGGKLYRVIQNLLDNSLKYSMEGSRVYFTLDERGSGYELEVRNICDSEPDFTADEIIERFARGDRSRTDGGSGLGLSIAKSFTEACGGVFTIELDRDIFIARVYFERREDAPVETEAETGEIASGSDP